MPDRTTPPSSNGESSANAKNSTRTTGRSGSTAKSTAAKATAKPAAKPVAKSAAAKSAAAKASAKPATKPTGKPAAKSSARPAGKSGGRPAAKAQSASAARSAAALKASGRPPSNKNRSIVNQRQTPWGLIITTVVIVVFAVGVIGFALLHHKSSSSKSDNPYTQPEIAAAKAISGVIYKAEPDHTHVDGLVNYNSSPPVGGNHSPYWADCSGTVYSAPIANENAVHMLEHGAVWITYRPGLAAAQLSVLEQLVSGVDRMALSPYPNLKTPISLQSWDYQLFVNDANDPRVQQFIAALKFNPATTPEQNATCSQPSFKQHPSTFGHPLSAPVSAT
jgi:hypothetical protein